MALRVLLADESSTIKKVIQLALQDYAVQVRSVNVGVDALEVARSFEPDLILADVLLQKRNGYEVAVDIKTDPVLKKVPVILMWSGFMELDETQFINCGANDKLEKPFNVEMLRALVQKWVPKTNEQKISEFLHFPTTITELEAEPSRLSPVSDATIPIESLPSITEQTLNDEKTADWDMDSFEDINKFMPTDHLIQRDVVTPDEPTRPSVTPPPPPDGLASFRLDTFDTEEEPLKVDLQQLNQAPVNLNNVLTQDEARKQAEREQNEFGPDLTAVPAAPAAPTPNAQLASIPQLTKEQLEEILRAQSKDIIEAVVWKIVPEMAGHMIRQEIERLLAEE